MKKYLLAKLLILVLLAANLSACILLPVPVGHGGRGHHHGEYRGGGHGGRR